MAMFMKVGPVQAADIDSESASDGQVLTADGAGGAEWRDAAAGGGVAFDGATIDVQGETGDWGVTVTLTLNGAPISGNAVYMAYFSGGAMRYTMATFYDDALEGFPAGIRELYATDELGGLVQSAYLVPYDATDVPTYRVLSLGDLQAYLNVILPTGRVVTSSEMTWEPGPPP